MYVWQLISSTHWSISLVFTSKSKSPSMLDLLLQLTPHLTPIPDLTELQVLSLGGSTIASLLFMLKNGSPTFGSRDQFPRRQFFHGCGGGERDGFRMISSALPLLCTSFLLLLHQLHFRSSGIRSVSQRLGTPAPWDPMEGFWLCLSQWCLKQIENRYPEEYR